MMSRWAARWGLMYRQPVSLLSIRVVYRLDHPQVPRKRLRHKQPCDAYGAGRWTDKWQVDVSNVSVVLLENMAFLAFHVPTIHDLMIAICLHHQKLLFCKKCKTNAKHLQNYAKLTSRLNANYFGNDVCEVSRKHILFDHGDGQFPTQPPPRRKRSVLLGRLREAGGKQNRNSKIHTGHQKQDLVIYTSHYP